ncbi:MAG: hypothetical protein K6A35_03920 [bacterium]|nr:hypothetical protein [bacterium]
MYSFLQISGETLNRSFSFLGRKWKTIVNFGILAAFIFVWPWIARAAIVEGEAVDKYVANPKYTEEDNRFVEESKTGVEVADEVQPVPTASPTSPFSNDSGYSEGAAMGGGQAAVPEAPNFTPEVAQPVSKKKAQENSNAAYIVLGVIVVIIGIGIMFFVAKNRED